MRHGRTVVALVFAVVGAIAWTAIERRLGGSHSTLPGFGLAALTALIMRRAVRSADDRHVPILSALFALGGMALGEYLAHRQAFWLEFHPAWALVWFAGTAVALVLPTQRLRILQRKEAEESARRDPLFARRELPPPRPRARGSTARIACAVCERAVDSATTTSTERGIVCRLCLPRAGYARILCGACGAMVDPTTTSSNARYGIVCDGCRAGVERAPAVGVARVRCEVCDELVDSDTTSGLEDRKIVCVTCYDDLEAGPNRDAAFR